MCLLRDAFPVPMYQSASVYWSLCSQEKVDGKLVSKLSIAPARLLFESVICGISLELSNSFLPNISQFCKKIFFCFLIIHSFITKLKIVLASVIMVLKKNIKLI